jgi:hypothetical protein
MHSQAGEEGRWNINCHVLIVRPPTRTAGKVVVVVTARPTSAAPDILAIMTKA